MSLEDAYRKWEEDAIKIGIINEPTKKCYNSCIHPTVDVKALLSSLQGNEVNSIKIISISKVKIDGDIIKQFEYDAIKCVATGEYSLAIEILESLL